MNREIRIDPTHVLERHEAKWRELSAKDNPTPLRVYRCDGRWNDGTACDRTDIVQRYEFHEKIMEEPVEPEPEPNRIGDCAADQEEAPREEHYLTMLFAAFGAHPIEALCSCGDRFKLVGPE